MPQNERRGYTCFEITKIPTCAIRNFIDSGGSGSPKMTFISTFLLGGGSANMKSDRGFGTSFLDSSLS